MPESIDLQIKPNIDLSSLEQQGAEMGKRISTALNKNSADAGKGYVSNINKAQKAFERFQKTLAKLDGVDFVPRADFTQFETQLNIERENLTEFTNSLEVMEATWNKQNRQKKKRTYFKAEVDASKEFVDAQRMRVQALESMYAEMNWQDKYNFDDQTDKTKNALFSLVGSLNDAERAFKMAELAEAEFLKQQDEATQKKLAKQQAEDTAKLAREKAKQLADEQKQAAAYQKSTSALQKYIDKAREETATAEQVSDAISRVVQRMVELESINGPLPADQTTEYERLSNTLAELTNRYAEVKLAKIQAQEQTDRDKEQEQYTKATIALQRYIDKAREETATLDDVRNAISQIIIRQAELEAMPSWTDAQRTEYERLSETLNELWPKYEMLKRAPQTEATVQAINQVTASVSRLVKKLAQVSGHAIKSAFSMVRKSITGMGNDSNDTSKEIQSLIRNIVKYGFGVRSIYFLYRRLRTAMVEALKDMAKFDTNGLGASLNQLSTSLQYLKSAWAAAFAPIVEYVTPVLVQLMDLLANVGNAIAALFATLTGKGTVVKAVKQQKALAGALGNTGSAASDAAGKLAAFDELNIIGNDSGGGGGGGSGSSDLPDGSFIVETIENELADLINANKWFEIGQLFADKLNALTEAADNWINDVFRPWGVKWATNLGNFMNGFIYHYNWELLGKTFADGINAIFDTANTWFTTVNWSWFGTRVADGLISAIETIDWTLIGETLGNKLNKTIDFLYGFVKSLFSSGRARQIADAIAEGIYSFFTTVHWDNLGETLSIGFNGVFDALKRFIQQYDWDTVGNTIANAFNTAVQNIDAKEAGRTFSTFVLKVFDQLSKIDLFAVGEKIGNFLASIDWLGILTKAVGNILELLSGVIKGFFTGEYGASIATAIVAALVAHFGVALAKIKLAELLGGQFLGKVLEAAGIGAGASAGASGAATGLVSGLSGIAGTVAPILGVAAALGGVALMLKQSSDWLNQYNEELFTLDGTTQGHIDKLDLLIQQTEGYHDASLRQMEVYETENDRVRTLADSYLDLFDENGKVKTGMEERANYYYSQLAGALGLEEGQLKDLVSKHGDLKTAIEEVITAKTQDRAISAYLDEYQHALDNTKTAQDAVTAAEADLERALHKRNETSQAVDKAQQDYIDHLGQGAEVEAYYKQKLDDAVKANGNAQYAIEKTKEEVERANSELVKINATAEFYEGYMAAIATNDTTLITAALKRMQDGYITAEEGDKESLQRQVKNMEEYYNLLLTEMQNGNPNVTQEMLDEAKGWVDTADKELGKLERVAREGMEDLKKGMTSKKQELLAEAERTGQSIANAYKTSLTGVLNGVNMGTPTATLPTYSYQSTSGNITPKMNGYARLATGAVLPPNDPFLAIVGDQKHGTNIEAPLSTIEDAVRNVVGDNSNYAPEVVELLQRLISVVESKNISISRREVGDAAISEINSRTRRTGNSPIFG